MGNQPTRGKADSVSQSSPATAPSSDSLPPAYGGGITLPPAYVPSNDTASVVQISASAPSTMVDSHAQPSCLADCAGSTDRIAAEAAERTSALDSLDAQYGSPQERAAVRKQHGKMSHESPWKTYTKGAVLGQGQYGKVLSCTHKETGKQYAVKCINMAKSNSVMMKREIEMMINIEHKWLISTHAAYERSGLLHVVMDLVPKRNSTSSNGPDMFAWLTESHGMLLIPICNRIHHLCINRHLPQELHRGGSCNANSSRRGSNQISK